MKPFYKRLPEDEWFDEIRLESENGPILRAYIKPRYKTSALSGDEWRISAWWQITNGGMWEDIDRYHRLEDACKGLYPVVFDRYDFLHDTLIESIDFYRKEVLLWKGTNDGKPLSLIHSVGHLPWAMVVAREQHRIEFDNDAYCFQPGCAQKAVSTYRLKMEYERLGNGWEPTFEQRRRFCKRHLRRGDCGLEDSDANYELIDGPGPASSEMQSGDVSESITIAL